MLKKFSLLLVVVLLAICGIFTFFFFRMGTHDAKVLAEFPTAYKNYDQAMADYSTALLAPNPDRIAVPSGLESKADQTLAALYSIASERISSLTINDGDLMQVMQEIASLSGDELEALKAYRSTAAGQAGNLEQLVNKFTDLSNQRQVGYERYLELAGVNK